MKVWYIKLHRSSEDNVLYFSEPFTKRQARSDLLMTTAFKDWVITVRWNIIEVKRWQNWYSEDSLASRRQRSRGKVRRFLNYLETIQQIVQHKSKVKSTITIINYDKYQWNDTTDSTTDGQQTDTIKKYKKEKEVKEYIIPSEQEVKEKIKEIYTEHIVNNNIAKYRLLLLFIMKWYTIKIDKKSFDKFFADMIDKSHRYGYSWEWFADRDTLLLKAKEMYERAEWWREMKNHMSTLNKFLSPNLKK